MGRQDVVSCFMAAARPTAQCHSQLHLLLRVHSHAWHASALPLAMSMQCQQHAPIALPGQRAGHREPRRGAHCEGRRQPWSSASGRDDRSRTAGRAARAACRPAGRATSGKPGQQIFMPPQIAMGTSASHQSPLWQDSGGVHSLACPLSTCRQQLPAFRRAAPASSTFRRGSCWCVRRCSCWTLPRSWRR